MLVAVLLCLFVPLVSLSLWRCKQSREKKKIVEGDFFSEHDVICSGRTYSSDLTCCLMRRWQNREIAISKASAISSHLRGKEATEGVLRMTRWWNRWIAQALSPFRQHGGCGEVCDDGWNEAGKAWG